MKKKNLLYRLKKKGGEKWEQSKVKCAEEKAGVTTPLVFSFASPISQTNKQRRGNGPTGGADDAPFG